MMAKVVGEDMIEWIERADFLKPKHSEIYWKLSSHLWMQKSHVVSNPYTLLGLLVPRLVEDMLFVAHHPQETYQLG
jgi:hypothetical protein